MRVFLCCFGILYGGGSWVDTEYVEPSKPPSLEQVLLDGAPEWLGMSVRYSRFDHTD